MIRIGPLLDAIREKHPDARVYQDGNERDRVLVYSPDVDGTHISILYRRGVAGEAEPVFMASDGVDVDGEQAALLGNFGPVPVLDALRALRAENLPAYEALLGIVRRKGCEEGASGFVSASPDPRQPAGALLVERLSAAARAVAAVEVLERAEAGRGRDESAYQLARARHAGAMRALDNAQEELDEALPRDGSRERRERHQEDIDRIEARRLGRLRDLCRKGQERDAAMLLRDLTDVGGTLSSRAMVAVIESGGSVGVLQIAAEVMMKPR